MKNIKQVIDKPNQNRQISLRDSPTINFPSRIGERYREVVKNARSPLKCFMLNQSVEVTNQVSNILSAANFKAKTIAGFKMGLEYSPEEKSAAVNAMLGVIKNYKWLTVPELKFIVEAGLRGDFDDDDNKSWAFNARFLNFWIKKYYETNRLKIMKEQMQHEQKLIEEKEDQEKQKLYDDAKEGNRKRFLGLYHSGEYDSESARYIFISFYKKLNDRNLLDITTQEKNKMYLPELERAKGKYRGKPEKFIEEAAKIACMIKTMKMQLTAWKMQKFDLEGLLNEYDL